MKTDLLVNRSWLAVAMAAALLTACRSSQPGSASFASVVISHRSAEDIRQTTRQVFREQGYEFHTDSSGQMIFEKEGKRANAIAHGGLYSTQQGAETWVRVKVSLVNPGAGTYRLQCRAFMVPHHGDGFFEDERPLPNFRSGPYQDILDEVAERLK